MDDTPRLTPSEYWEWRTTISEMDEARERYLRIETELKVLQRDAEIVSLRAKLHQKTMVDSAKAGLQISKDEYERYKKALEERLGFSLNNKLIDDMTFEVKDLPEDKPVKE